MGVCPQQSHENTSDVAIGFVYIPREGSTHIPYGVKPFDMLQNAIMGKFKQHVVYICGDTNARTGTYDDYICVDKFGEVIAGLTSRLFESKYTCFRPNGASPVDYLSTTLENSKYLASFNVLDRDIYSDHCPLSFIFHANKGMNSRRESKPIPNSYKLDPKYRYIYRKPLTDPVAKSMRNNFLCDIVTQEITPNEVVKKFKALIE